MQNSPRNRCILAKPASGHRGQLSDATLSRSQNLSKLTENRLVPKPNIKTTSSRVHSHRYNVQREYNRVRFSQFEFARCKRLPSLVASVLSGRLRCTESERWSWLLACLLALAHVRSRDRFPKETGTVLSSSKSVPTRGCPTLKKVGRPLLRQGGQVIRAIRSLSLSLSLTIYISIYLSLSHTEV